MASTPLIHQSATAGFDNATAYDKHRPSYPPEAVQKLLEHIGLASNSHGKIVDLAAGTGKFTELLAAREEKFEILAVEPHDSMRRSLEEKGLLGVESRAGTAERMGLDDGWADAVVVAQAFHWFAKEESLEEIRRVLKPGGKLAMIWNIEDYNKPRSWKAVSQWEQDLHELIIDAATDCQPRFRNDVWHEVFGRQKDLFTTPIGQDKTEWTIWMSKKALWERVRTLSHVAVLEGMAKEDFRGRFDRIVDGGDARWNEKGELAIHGVTPFAWTTRL